METNHPAFAPAKPQGICLFMFWCAWVGCTPGWSGFLVFPQKGFSKAESVRWPVSPTYRRKLFFRAVFSRNFPFGLRIIFRCGTHLSGLSPQWRPFMGVPWNSIRLSRRTAVRRTSEDASWVEEFQLLEKIWRVTFLVCQRIRIPRKGPRCNWKNCVCPTGRILWRSESRRKQNPEDHARLERVEIVFITGTMAFTFLAARSATRIRYANRFKGSLASRR